MAIKWVKEINIINTQFEGDDTDVPGGKIYVDDAKFSGTATAYLEVVAINTHASDSGIYIFNPSVIASNCSIPANTTTWTRIRGMGDAYFAANEIQLRSGPTGTKTVRAARVVIIQSHATAITATETQIEIGAYEAGIYTSSSSTFVPLTYPKIWYFDSDNWDGTLSWEAEVVWEGLNDKETTVIRLEYSSDKSSWYAAQTIYSGANTEAVTRTRVTWSGGPTDAYYYRLGIACSATKTGYGVNIYLAKIVCTQTDATEITKTESYRLLVNANIASTGLTNYDQRYDESGEWDGVTVDSYHEVVGSSSSAAAKLQEDPNGTPSDITNSAVTCSGANELTRGGSAMTMPSSAKDVDTNITTTSIHMSRIVHIITVGGGVTYKNFSGTAALVSSTPGVDILRLANFAGTAALVSSLVDAHLLRYLPFAGTAGLVSNTQDAILARILPLAGSADLVTNCPDAILQTLITKNFAGIAALVTAMGDVALNRYAQFSGAANLVSNLADVGLLRYSNFSGSVGLESSLANVSLNRIANYLGTSPIVVATSTPAILRYLGFSGVADLVTDCPDCDLNVLVIKNFAGLAPLVSGTSTADLMRYANLSGSSDLASSTPNANLLRILTLAGIAALVTVCPDCILSVDEGQIFKDFYGLAELITAISATNLNRYANYSGQSDLVSATQNVVLGRYSEFIGSSSLVTATSLVDLLRYANLSGASDLLTATSTVDLNRYANLIGQVDLVVATSTPELLRILNLYGSADLVTICSLADLSVLGATPGKNGPYLLLFRRRKR